MQIRLTRHVASLGALLVLPAALLLLLAAVSPGLAAEPGAIPVDKNGLPLWQIRQWDDAPVRLGLADRTAVQRLLAEVPLSRFSRENLQPGPDGWMLEIRVTPEEAVALTAAGYDFVPLTDTEKAGRQAVEQAWATASSGAASESETDKSDAPALDYYPPHAEIGTLLADLAANYPAICRTFSWGQSVQGRELWGLVVSGDVNNTTAEPEVRLSSTMHGDEVVGMILLLNLAHHLVQNHGQAGYEDLTDLIDGTEIHIMPLHNPDGYVAGRRANARSVDLNRNFPLPAGSHPVQEIENLNYMAYADNHHFVISQNGHGGALVVNYPWDFTFDRAPDDLAIIQLSLEYSTYNLPMYNGAFDRGITHGADWYRVNGTVQDWSYDQTDCIDVTIEVAKIKWPDATSLAGYWDDNRESLLHFIAAAHYGVNGVVTDSVSGDPLQAIVTVTGNTKSVHTDDSHGDYYKLLETGTWDLTFSAEGYQAQTVSGVNTTWGTATVLDVQLALDGGPVPRADTLRTAVVAWPNPFNAGTTLTLTVPEAGPVSLSVYDLKGRRVRELLAAGMESGDHPIIWDGLADNRTAVPSGVYFARAVTPEGQATAKLMLVK